MNTPPLILGSALLFWGWQAGIPGVGAVVALAVEGSRLTRTRWTFAQTDLDRIWNLCVLLCFGMGIFLFIKNDGAGAFTEMLGTGSFAARAEKFTNTAHAAILIVLWLPLPLFPIALTQAYSDQPRMDWSTFSMLLRRQRSKQRTHLRHDGINVSWPYFVLCLVSSCASNKPSLHFLIGLACLVGWALWSRRPRGASITAWTTSLLLVSVLGFTTQQGLSRLKHLLHRLDSKIMNRLFVDKSFDSNESRTRIGSVGRMKLSGKIVLRVETDGQPAPALLRQASYNRFRSPNWGCKKQQFLSVDNEDTTWKLLPHKTVRKSVRIAGYLPGGRGLLAVPAGVARLDDLPVFVLETNSLGVVRAQEGPGLVQFQAAYDHGQAIDSAPDLDDLDVPRKEQSAVAEIAAQLNLAAHSPERKLQIIARYFADNFSYSTWLPRSYRTSSNRNAIAEFLLNRRSGHCEYFATATVLLLRQANIPARYAVGYSVQERKGGKWIVRQRHAHAWCLAWLNGEWREVDNTPASWAETEASRASPWERLYDLWSAIWFEFSKWRWGNGAWKEYATWLLPPLLLFAGWRLVSQKQWIRTRRPTRDVSPQLPRPGRDSEFYSITQKLIKAGFERRQGETLSTWVGRTQSPTAPTTKDLLELLQLHYRLRFDPHGLTPTERTTLRDNVNAWLENSKF